jgi:hypothetical protein
VTQAVLPQIAEKDINNIDPLQQRLTITTQAIENEKTSRK